jgi:predicted lipoprotein
MARAAGSWLALGALALGVGVVQLACETGGDSADVDPTVQQLLADFGPLVVEPALSTWRAELDALEAAALAWQDEAYGDTTTTAAHLAAQDQFVAAFLAWHAVEPLQVGPLGSSLSVPGGLDLADEIYSWPSVNGCRVDQETLAQEYGDADWVQTQLSNAYGLDALEHLLWSGLETECPSQVGIDDQWDALSVTDLTRARADYAVALVGVLQDHSDAVDAQWATHAQALAAGADPYDDALHALDTVFGALFYVDGAVKDRKLGQPLGLLDCDADTCPDHAEALLSGQGAPAVSANLQGFVAAFNGGDGTGLDDVLVEHGHGDLAAQIQDAAATAIATADATPAALDQAIADDPAAVEALHADVKALTDLLKGDLVTVLTLTLPDEAAGDAD